VKYDEMSTYPLPETYTKSYFVNQWNFILSLSYPISFENKIRLKPYFETTMPLRPIGKGRGSWINDFAPYSILKPGSAHFTFRIGIVTEITFKKKNLSGNKS
jgi:hypothetical protein